VLWFSSVAGLGDVFHHHPRLASADGEVHRAADCRRSTAAPEGACVGLTADCPSCTVGAAGRTDAEREPNTCTP
jgi:hypothetical protein